MGTPKGKQAHTAYQYDRLFYLSVIVVDKFIESIHQKCPARLRISIARLVGI